MPTRILVCGGRDYLNYEAVVGVLDRLWGPDYLDTPTILSGGAKGADALAKAYAFSSELPYEEYPADWKQHGKAAGFIRNQKMLDEGKPDLVVAFPGGSGTADMVRRARKAGVEVIVVE